MSSSDVLAKLGQSVATETNEMRPRAAEVPAAMGPRRPKPVRSLMDKQTAAGTNSKGWWFGETTRPCETGCRLFFRMLMLTMYNSWRAAAASRIHFARCIADYCAYTGCRITLSRFYAPRARCEGATQTRKSDTPKGHLLGTCAAINNLPLKKHFFLFLLYFLFYFFPF